MTTVLVTASPDGTCRRGFDDVDVMVEPASRWRQSRPRGYDNRHAA